MNYLQRWEIISYFIQQGIPPRSASHSVDLVAQCIALPNERNLRGWAAAGVERPNPALAEDYPVMFSYLYQKAKDMGDLEPGSGVSWLREVLDSADAINAVLTYGRYLDLGGGR